MPVQMTQQRGVPVAQVSGVIDSTNATLVAGTLLAAVPNSAPGLVLDLTETTLVDSVGVRLLFEIVDRLRRRGQQLRVIVAADTAVEDVARLSDLGSYAPLDPGVERAVEQLSNGHR
jgi:anti-sigma B factor antagonist